MVVNPRLGLKLIAGQGSVELLQELHRARRPIERIGCESARKELTLCGCETSNAVRRHGEIFRHHLQCDHREGPEVPVGRRFVAPQVFGGHVRPRAGHRACFGEQRASRPFERLGQAEVENLGHAVRTEKIFSGLRSR